MRAFPENFEWLGLWEAHFGAPKVMGQDMLIPVKNLPVQGDHPLRTTKDKVIRRHPALGGVVDGLLVFREVSLSKRRVDEYIGVVTDPYGVKGFRDPYELVDVDVASSEKMNTYLFEGVLEEPYAWVTWDIIARSFELQVD
ncbi:MAG: hypothetical protein LBE06_08550 [Azoarcus sp.]|jgi:hypothetical protein|nr:hypothetical protein [Azoarcus sp.]